ncbi:MAG: isoleucine--tRNA ligase [Thermoguttaceae bacterium]|nr:isoleucine--tRNA ligase [Thermoguttaceae bacterium]
MFQPVDKSSFPKQEESLVKWWDENRIYEKSLELRKNAPSFVFFEGPPTANGHPHPGHCLTRAIKDLFPRYKTMKGFLCTRKAGWDTHGLPVEGEVCKELGIKTKEQIIEYGIEPFVQLCQKSVFRYITEWEDLTKRIGFWVNLDEAYVTYHKSFVESVWHSLKTLFDQGLLYQGHKIVWWWAQGGTALSSGEVGQGYREVADPSVFIKFPLVDDQAFPDESLRGASLVVWTTTPWTLPSNQFAAVKPDLDYALLEFEPIPDKNGNVAPADPAANDAGKFVVAVALADVVAGKLKKKAKILKTFKGSDLIGLRYIPPFDYYYKTLGAQQGELLDGSKEYIAWRVVPAEFVTTDSGSGLVHQAPAFGEDDHGVLLDQQKRYKVDENGNTTGPELICAVGPDGKFTEIASDWTGRWVKEADKDISRNLKERGILLHLEQYLHEYPFCYREEKDPLIQYPRKSWYIKTTSFVDQMLENNSQINWMPDHIKDGRFGNFLATNVDWALSRERFWGTPLPIWVCEKTGQMEAIGSFDELLSKPGVTGREEWEKAKAKYKAETGEDLCDDLQVHKPYIDYITYDSPFAPGARMKRVPEVIDCWYDSGSMPFAQWGWPNKPGSDADLKEHFPADFISEAIDQTRGWFYSQLAISTMMFGKTGTERENALAKDLPYPHPFKNCIVLGLMLSEWWESPDGKVFLTADAAKEAGVKAEKKVGKMSKSKRNYPSPQQIFDTLGADALRWYFYATQAPWNSVIYSTQAIRDSVPEFLLRLWNVYGFFTIYANIDGFDPKKAAPRPVAQRAELDRWILSELNKTIKTVTEKMDAYDSFGASACISAFVDALSNWYVRSSRDRFWASDKQDADKIDAYSTLYECLTTLVKVIAPFVPFISEKIYQALVASQNSSAPESVHLCDYPVADESLIDETLSFRMGLVREIVSLGRAARSSAKLKVRQPLKKVEVVLTDDSNVEWLVSHETLVADELNVKQVAYTTDAAEYIEYNILPDLKKLGPKLGKNIGALRNWLKTANAKELLEQMKANGKVTVELNGTAVDLAEDELIIRLSAKEGWTAAQGDYCVVVLSTELDEALLAEGLAREIVHAIQNLRKESGCEYTDRIQVSLVSDAADLTAALLRFADYIKAETLSTELASAPLDGVAPVEVKLDGKLAQLYLKK